LNQLNLLFGYGQTNPLINVTKKLIRKFVYINIKI